MPVPVNVPGPEILHNILKAFENVVLGTRLDVQSVASSLLFQLATLDIIFAALWWFWSDEAIFLKLCKKVLVISVFVYFIGNYTAILSWVIDGFLDASAVASGVDVSSVMKDPGKILAAGLLSIKPLVDKAAGLSFTSIASIFLIYLTCVPIILVYLFLSLTVFITMVEFYLLSALALIFLPFGVFRHTSFLAEKTFGLLISFGVKIMVLSFILAIGYPLIETLALPEDASFSDGFTMLGAILTICVLSWHTPSLAAGLLAGGPTLSGSGLIGGVAKTASTALSAVSGGMSAMKGSAASAGAAGRVSATAAGAAYGALAQSASNYKDARASGSSTLGSLGAVVQAPASSARSAVSSAMQARVSAVSESLGGAFESGREKGQGSFAKASEKAAGGAVSSEASGSSIARGASALSAGANSGVSNMQASKLNGLASKITKEVTDEKEQGEKSLDAFLAAMRNAGGDAGQSLHHQGLANSGSGHESKNGNEPGVSQNESAKRIANSSQKSEGAGQREASANKGEEKSSGGEESLPGSEGASSQALNQSAQKSSSRSSGAFQGSQKRHLNASQLASSLRANSHMPGGVEATSGFRLMVDE